MPVICALIPRFQLASAVAGASEALASPSALAPEPGAAQLIGEVSEPAERLGLRAGMRIGEALSRCPGLALIQPDPELAIRSWEGVIARLERIGARVESGAPGEAYFSSGGLHRLWGGLEGVLGRARSELEGADAASVAGVRLGAAPSRFCAYAAARAHEGIVPDGGARAFLSPLPVSLLHGRLAGGEDLPNNLERLGIATLGALAALPRDAVADRFGSIGLRALALARGRDAPLRPRAPAERIAAEIELPEAVSGPQLERAAQALIARLLAHRARRGRTIRVLAVSARLAQGGGWRREAALRRPSADPERLALVLRPHLALLPAPAAVLRLEAPALGAEEADQLSMAGPEQRRREQIAEAVRQVRAAGGSEAVLRVIDADPGSRLPERRAVLIPFPEEAP